MNEICFLTQCKNIKIFAQEVRATEMKAKHIIDFL